MLRVWKETLALNSIRDQAFEVEVPARRGSRPLSVQVQRGIPTLWFTAEETAPPERLTLYCVGTGFGAVPEGVTFLATVQHQAYVWHVFWKEK